MFVASNQSSSCFPISFSFGTARYGVEWIVGLSISSSSNRSCPVSIEKVWPSKMLANYVPWVYTGGDLQSTVLVSSLSPSKLYWNSDLSFWILCGYQLVHRGTPEGRKERCYSNICLRSCFSVWTLRFDIDLGSLSLHTCTIREGALSKIKTIIEFDKLIGFAIKFST